MPLETRNASTYYLPFDNTASVTTVVALANLAAQAANVQVIIRDDTGAQIGTTTILLPAQGHVTFILGTQYPATTGKRGTIQFQTPLGGQISVLGLRSSGSVLTTYPALANVGTTGGSMANIASGAGWQTTFMLVNTGTSAAQAQLNFFDNGGNPLVLPLTGIGTASSVTQTIPAGASLWVQSTGLITDPLLTGSAQLTTTGNISGFPILHYNPTGQETWVPLETRTPGSFALAFDNTGALTTNVALANAGASAANITANIYDDLGNPLQIASIALPAHGSTEFILSSVYPITSGKRGMVQFVVPPSGAISVMGIRSLNGTLATIPALATPQSPVVTWPNPPDIQFGSALGSGQLNATANVPGTFVYTPPAGTVLGAGNGQKLSATFTPTDTVNYIGATATASINVLPVPHGDSAPACDYAVAQQIGKCNFCDGPGSQFGRLTGSQRPVDQCQNRLDCNNQRIAATTGHTPAGKRQRNEPDVLECWITGRGNHDHARRNLRRRQLQLHGASYSALMKFGGKTQ